MRNLVRIMALGFAAWTLFHIAFSWDDHTYRCDDCPTVPYSAWWVSLLRVAAWSAALVAIGRAHDVPTRARAGLAGACLVALAAAMLFLPEPPVPEEVPFGDVKNPTTGASLPA